MLAVSALSCSVPVQKRVEGLEEDCKVLAREYASAEMLDSLRLDVNMNFER